MTSLCGQRLPLSAVLTLAITSVIAVTLGLPGASHAHEADGHPARIHEGTCDEIGPVTDQLTGVGAEISLDGTPIPAAEMVGSEAAVPIDVSTTTLESQSSYVIDTPHAIVVYESDEAMDEMLVCGNVGGALLIQMDGMPMPGDEVAIWLAPQGDADYTGLALLRSEEGRTSSVTIFLAEGLSGGAAVEDHHEDTDTPEATPTSG